MGTFYKFWKNKEACTAESREELHESAYKETLEVQINTILNLIFEET